MRLHHNDPCPECGERLVLRRLLSPYTLFRKRHFLLCPVCNFSARARRAGRQPNSHYLVLAQEARMSARRYEGKQRAALLNTAESWEKQANAKTDPLIAIHGQSLPWRPWLLSRSKTIFDAFRLANIPKPLTFALALLVTGIFVTRFAVDGGSTAVEASEADRPASTTTSNATGTSSVGYESAEIASRNLAAVAIADVHPISLMSIVPVLVQDVQLADSSMRQTSLSAKAAIGEKANSSARRTQTPSLRNNKENRTAKSKPAPHE